MHGLPSRNDQCGIWSKVSEPGSLSDAEHIELMNKMLQAYSKNSARTRAPKSNIAAGATVILPRLG